MRTCYYMSHYSVKTTHTFIITLHTFMSGIRSTNWSRETTVQLQAGVCFSNLNGLPLNTGFNLLCRSSINLWLFGWPYYRGRNCKEKGILKQTILRLKCK